jgi:hypothetical protein
MADGNHEGTASSGAPELPSEGSLLRTVAERARRAGWGLGAASIQWGKRPAASRPVAVTKRDRGLLALLHDVNYLSASQLALLGWGEDSTCARLRVELPSHRGGLAAAGRARDVCRREVLYPG